MAEKHENDLVGMLRQRTVEEELKQYLKSTMGGYTKKSVKDYIKMLRDQQIQYAETFNRNIQAVFEEKEALKKENEHLRLKNTQVSSDYQSLSESLKINGLEDVSSPEQELLMLRNGLSAAEAENRDLRNAERQFNARIERLEEQLSELDTDLKKAQQEKKSLSEILALEKKETNKQRELVASYTGIIEELQTEIRRFKQVLSDGEITKLRIKISELMANTALKDELIDRYKNELTLKDDDLGMLTEDNQTLRHSLDQVKSTLVSLTIQNEKLMSANNTLSSNLEAENKRIIQLLNEKSEQTVEKLIAARKLDELNMKLSIMQLLPDNTPEEEHEDEAVVVENISAS